MNGVYTTAPSKMVKYEDEFTILEGVVNRGIAKYLYEILQMYGVDFMLIYDEIADTPLHTRISLANKLQEKKGNCIVVSIHCNAGGGSGIEVFTSTGQDKSDIIAESLALLMKADFPEFKFRADKTDGDLDKEANFAMVGGNKRTPLKTLASVLIENFFMDNRAEAELLVTPAFQQRIAGTIGRWILEIEKTQPI